MREIYFKEDFENFLRELWFFIGVDYVMFVMNEGFVFIIFCGFGLGCVIFRKLGSFVLFLSFSFFRIVLSL